MKPDPGFVAIAADEEKLSKDCADVSWDRHALRHAAWGRGQWPDWLKPTMEQVVAAVEEMVGGDITVRRHQPAGVEISVMQRPESDALIIHAVNYGVAIDGGIAPAESVRVSVCVSDGARVSHVAWHALDGIVETLPVIEADGRVEFVIPRLEIYGIALLKVQSR
jgi:hypothetical protein